ncbi:MAG: ExeA family protein [Alphaproteobacteria bacterium]|nr:ExeA family protein [Alphaproteobacteria bacterium]MCB9795851.1 ExeA family protein [Alphaproteobacteria bacterium]
MNKPTIPKPQKRRLQAHFGLTGLPFRKNVQAAHMFDSASQRDMLHGLLMWLECQGIALITGPSGAGKSITTRRFIAELPRDRYAVFNFGQIPTTPNGFLRALCRRLGLRARRHTADLFDEAHDALANWAERKRLHPVLVLDDAEGMAPATLDLLRRLTAVELDGEDRFSVLLIGTEELLVPLRLPALEPLRNRLVYVAALRPFSIEDTRNYVRFHLAHAGARDALISEDAVQQLFQATRGVPRAVNQVALQALIQAAVHGLDTVDGGTMKRVLHAHPLYGPGSRRGG